jgi:uncharacterized protein YaaQ
MAMKLVVAIVQNEDADDLIDGLTAAHYGATRLASTGGFLRQGNTTIIVGVPDEAVQNVLTIVAQHSQSRRQPVTNPFPDSTAISSRKSGNPLEQFIDQSLTGKSPEIQTGRATVFVLNLDRYERV